MTVDEDSSWLDALAGRTDRARAQSGAEPAPSSVLVLEALALRGFIQSQEPDPASPVPTVDAARERELLERARKEGLLPREAAPPHALGSAAPRRPRFADSRITFAVAAMVLAAIGIGLWRATLAPIEMLRGTVNGTVHLEARDPPALKRQLTEELTAAGLRVSGYERLGHLGIDADLPQPVSSPIAAILQRHHIPIPADGVLDVEIDAPGRQ
jgi:hypothetical protein